MRRIRLLLALALFGWSLEPAFAQSTSTIQGRVTNERGNPLGGVQVSLTETSQGALTNAQGEYEIARVAPGTYTLQSRSLGYRTKTATITVGTGATLRHNFVLAEEAISLRPIEVTVGSRVARSAAEELPVPVDVLPAADVTGVGKPETAEILQELAPSVNFPRQTVSDGSDAVRPFTLRGLSPDHSLVLVNGKRRHKTALVHVFGSGISSGSSGVDLNAIPAAAIDRIEVLRDGAAAQYGSDAIAGVINVVLKEGVAAPTFGALVGGYAPSGRDPDGRIYDVSGSWGIPLGKGSLNLFGSYTDRGKTNRAGVDPRDQVTKGDGGKNAIGQPNHHWGDGAAKNALLFWNASVPLGNDRPLEFYSFGGVGARNTISHGFFRRAMDSRNWPQIYPNGFLPTFDTDVQDISASAGLRGALAGWAWDLNGLFGRNQFDYTIANSLNTSLGPDANQTTFFAGSLELSEYVGSLDVTRALEVGLASPLHLSWGGALRIENYGVIAGEPNSYLDGGHPNQYGGTAAPGSQVFPGFRPENAADEWRNNVGLYVDAEANLTEKFLVVAATRFESYSDFGETLTGKLALRYQPSEQWTFRSAASTGFRAPSLSQSFYSTTSTNFDVDPETGVATPYEIGIFPVHTEVARTLGAQPLQEEKSINLSAGLAFSPIDNLTFTSDYFFIRLNDRIILSGELSGERIEELLAPYGARVARFFTNAINTETQGVDLTANYRTPLWSDATLRLTGTFNYTQNRLVGDVVTPPVLEGLGNQLFGESAQRGLEREAPAIRGGLTARYYQGKLSTQVGADYYGGYTSTLWGGDPQEYSPKTLIDAEMGYTISERLRFALGAKNVFDVMPDRMNDKNSFLGIFPYPRASPFGFNGRYVYARMNVTPF